MEDTKFHIFSLFDRLESAKVNFCYELWSLVNLSICSTAKQVSSEIGPTFLLVIAELCKKKLIVFNRELEGSARIGKTFQ